jgi:hypothetical protein
MAYAQLNSPLPNLTLPLRGCGCPGGGCRCAAHGLGDDSTDGTIDTSSDDNFGSLTDPTITPVITPVITTQLPVETSTSSVYSGLPSTVGTEFISNGDGTYTNIQTGQSVPYATALSVTQATTGAATSSLSTTSTYAPTNGTQIVDPTTGVTYTYSSSSGQFAGSDGSTATLTAAAQALQAAGQLVTAAGQLTAAGQALAASGGLAAPVASTVPVTPASSTSSALNSLSNWFSAQSMIAGVPNGVVALGFVGALMILPSLLGGKKRR